MKAFIASIVAIVLVALVSQAVLTRFAGESSELRYSDPTARPD